MGQIILPDSYNPDFSNPRKKPKGNVKIKWSNEFAKGIEFLNLGDAGKELVSNSPMVISGFSPSISNQIVNGEKTLVTAGDVDVGYILPKPVIVDVDTPWEVTFKVRRRGPNAKGMIFGENPEANCYFWCNNSVIEFASFSGTFHSFSTGYVPSDIATYTIISDGGGAGSATLKFYIDGVHKQTISSATSDLDIRVFIDGYGVPGLAFQGDVFSGKITVGVFYSDDMVARQFSDVRQILELISPPIYFIPETVVAGGDLLLTNRSIANYQGMRQ